MIYASLLFSSLALPAANVQFESWKRAHGNVWHAYEGGPEERNPTKKGAQYNSTSTL